MKSPLESQSDTSDAPAIFGRSIWHDGATFAMVLGIDGSIASVNQFTEEVLGRTAEELKGSVLWRQLAPEAAARCKDAFQQAVECRKAQWIEIAFNGQRQELVLRPCYEDGGVVTGVSLIGRQSTVMQETFESINHSERRLRFTLESTDIGIWEFNVASGKAWRSTEHARIFGYEDNSNPWKYADFLQHIADSDRRRVEQTIKSGLEAKKGWAFDCRIHRRDGAERWIWVNCGLTVSEEGIPQQVNGLIMDVTDQKTARDELARIGAEMKTILDTVPVGVSFVKNRRPIWVNPALDRLFDYQNGESIGMEPDAFYARKEDCIRVGTEGYAALRRGATYATEVEFKRKDGSTFWCSLFSRAVNAANAGEGSIWVLRDITERKAMTDQLKIQNEILNYMQEGVVMVQSSDGAIVYTNPKYNAMLGCEAGELIGQHVSVVNDPAAGPPEKVAEHIINHLKAHGAWEGEVANRRIDGATIWNHAVVSKFSHSRFGEVWIAVVNDVTARRAAELALRNANERYDELVCRIPSGVYQYRVRLDGSVHLDYASQKTAELFGVPLQDIKTDATSWCRCVHPDDKPLIANAVNAAVNGPADFNWSGCFVVNGHKRWLHVHGKPARQPNGDVVWNGAVTDITAIKKYQQQVERQSVLIEAMINSIPDILFFKNCSGVYMSCNNKMAQALGRTKAEIVGSTDYDLFSKEEADAFQADDKQAVGSMDPLHLEETFSYPDGTCRVVDTLKSRVVGPRGEILGVLGVARDITERKRLETALQRNEQMQRTILASMVEGVVFQGADGVIIDCNASAEKILGISRGQMLGRDSIDKKWRAIREDGAEFPREEHPAMLSLRTGKGFRSTPMGLELPDGSRRWISINTEPLFHLNESKPYAVISSFADITARKEMEERLFQSQKMEAIGHLAGGMAHEFNNILATMMMSLSLAKIEANEESRPEMLAEMENSCKRAAEIISQLLAFSRQSVMNRCLLDLAQVVSGYVRPIQPLLGERIDLQHSLATGLPAVKADKNLIEQVLLNLCLNAKDAMKKGGILRLELGLETVSDERARINADARAGQYVKLAVSDTGCGMDEATMKRLFEPFFTTKDVGRGTGLGLATVRGIVMQHQGWVEVESQPGRGSTFRVYLPAADSTATPPCQPQMPTKTVQSGKGSILLVEDDVRLRNVTRTMLAGCGYKVLEAADGAAAMAAWVAHGGEIDLLYTDMVMPGEWTGLQLAERLQAQKSSLKVVITSGYNTDIVDLEKAAAAAIVYLPKPCTPDVLMDVIARCLSRQPQAGP